MRYIDINGIIKQFKRVKELEKDGWEYYEYEPLYEKLKFRKHIKTAITTHGRIIEKYKYKFLPLTNKEKDFIRQVSICSFEENPDRCIQSFKQIYKDIFENSD